MAQSSAGQRASEIERELQTLAAAASGRESGEFSREQLLETINCSPAAKTSPGVASDTTCLRDRNRTVVCRKIQKATSSGNSLRQKEKREVVKAIDFLGFN